MKPELIISSLHDIRGIQVTLKWYTAQLLMIMVTGVATDCDNQEHKVHELL